MTEDTIKTTCTCEKCATAGSTCTCADCTCQDCSCPTCNH